MRSPAMRKALAGSPAPAACQPEWRGKGSSRPGPPTPTTTTHANDESGSPELLPPEHAGSPARSAAPRKGVARMPSPQQLSRGIFSLLQGKGEVERRRRIRRSRRRGALTFARNSPPFQEEKEQAKETPQRCPFAKRRRLSPARGFSGLQSVLHTLPSPPHPPRPGTNPRYPP